MGGAVRAGNQADTGSGTARTGAVQALAGAVVPLGGEAVRIGGGLLADWQRRNREATIPHVIGQLRAAGNVANLSRLLASDPAPYQGRYPFGDTDLYKSLEGIAYELTRDDSPREFYEEIVTLLQAVQAGDGYLNSRFQDPASAAAPWSDLAWGHEMYNLGHLIQAAVVAHRRLGDDRLLHVAVKFADLVVSKFGEQGQDAVCGHPEVEMALVELYRTTGKRDYLRQAQLFIDRRGRATIEHHIFPPAYWQDHRPLREMQTVTGHAVRMTYLAAGAADVWAETGDETLGMALRRLWDDMAASKLYITGGLGSRHSDEAIGDRFELPPERSYSETCAAIGLMQWAWRMFIATGSAQFLDVYETVLYNAFAVGLAADGRGFFYDNPLQRRPDHLQNTGAEIGGEPLRRPWFGCACCPPNVVRWMAQLGDYLAAERPGELLIANYAAASITGSRLAVTVTTSYPWNGEVRVRVDAAPGEPQRITLRVPAWASGALLDGRPAQVADGWVTAERNWQAGDELLLTLPMRVRAHGSHPYVDATRGALAVARGPLIYCAEQCDSGADIDDLVLGPEGIAAAQAHPGPADLPESIAITMTGQVSPPQSAELYPELTGRSQAVRGEAVPVTLVPYFLWGNRGPGSMRVWIRASTPEKAL